MLEGVLLLWYLLTAGSLLYVLYDLITNTPTTWVMKLAWLLVVLYTGPIGLFIFLVSCRQPLPGTHDRYIAAPWKQGVGSLMHCVAGDATGIVLAAILTYRARFPTGIDMLIEYAAAFLVGLLVFQALFMRFMTHAPYWQSVRKSFFPETVSMNMVMLGMIPTKFLLMHQIAGGDNPLRPQFWGIMSAATLVGMATAYPINAWMVRRGIKHGMMSAMPKPGAMPAPGGMVMPGGKATAATPPATATAVGAMPMAGAMSSSMPMAAPPVRPAPAALPRTQSLAILLGTTVLFAAAIVVTAMIIPLRFL